MNRRLCSIFFWLKLRGQFCPRDKLFFIGRFENTFQLVSKRVFQFCCRSASIWAYPTNPTTSAWNTRAARAKSCGWIWGTPSTGKWAVMATRRPYGWPCGSNSGCPRICCSRKPRGKRTFITQMQRVAVYQPPHFWGCCRSVACAMWFMVVVGWVELGIYVVSLIDCTEQRAKEIHLRWRWIINSFLTIAQTEIETFNTC